MRNAEVDDEVAKVLDAAHERAQQAYHAKDAVAYMGGFSPELRYTQRDGTTIGYKELLRDVERQLARVSAVGGGYERMSLVVNGDSASETLVQNAWVDMRVFFVFTKRWHVRRKGIYEWARSAAGWQIVRVKVLEESTR